MENTKRCIKCGKELPLDQFYESYLKKHYYCCINCRKILDKEWYIDNAGIAKRRVSEWQKNNPEKARIRNARWRKKNPERSLMWAKNNTEKRKAIVNRYRNKSRAINPSLRIIHSIQSIIGHALKNKKNKAARTIELLGCTGEELQNYLESKFLHGMTWDNYGLHGWHIDHIIPLSYFNLTDPEQQRRAFHYTNLQPLWAIDNIKKGNKIIEVQLMLL